MPRSAKMFLMITGLIAVLSGIGIWYFSGQKAPDTTEPPASNETTVPESTGTTEPASTPIDYQLQGYLVYNNEIISQANLTVRNPDTPPLSTQNDPVSFSFEYMYVSDFPVMENEPSCCVARELKDNILELKLTKIGTVRDPETGNPKLTMEAEYTILIDQTNSEFLMCTIRTFLDGSTQQYYFITTNSTRVISQILERAYST